MKIEDYVISDNAVDSEDVDLDGLTEWEKESILKVLKRNNRVKYREERRLEQLAVRVQMQRLTDQRSPQDETEIKTKTGEWHKDLVRRRCSGRPVDVPATLYRRISIDLITHEPRKRTKLTRSLTSSPCYSGAQSRSPISELEDSPISESGNEVPWMEGAEFDGSSFKASTNTNDVGSDVKVNDVDLTKHLSENFKREATDQREI